MGGSAPGPLHIYILQFSVQYFYRTPKCVYNQISDPCACSWALFLLLVCLVQLKRNGFCLPYYILFCSVCCLLKAYTFLMRDGRGPGPERSGLKRNWACRGRGNSKQDIQYEKQATFNWGSGRSEVKSEAGVYSLMS